MAAMVAIGALAFPATRAQTVRQLTDTHTREVRKLRYVIDDDGQWVYLVGSTDAFGDNPVAAFQLFRVDPTTGEGQRVSDIDGGIASATVSDDGVWVAFASSGDPKGQNQDRSSELFVMQSNGTHVNQLTHTPSPEDGSVSWPVISGDGSHIVFFSTVDHDGTNSEHVRELWITERDGSNLKRLTHTSGEGVVFPYSVSDDTTRIVFSAASDPLGTNPDGGEEIFAVNGDGSGLRQLTNTEFTSTAPFISGNGSTIVFQSRGDVLPPGNPFNIPTVYAMNWDGTGLTQLTGGIFFGEYPTITDDGQTVFFDGPGHHADGQNSDQNQEIWSVQRDGTGMRRVSDTKPPVAFYFPEVSGSGNRLLAFYDGGEPPWGHNPDGGLETASMDTDGADPTQLMDAIDYYSQEPDITADGSTVVFAANGTLAGNTNDYRSKIFAVNFDSTNLQQLTFFVGTSETPVISDDGSTIIFCSDGNPLDGNPDRSKEIFAMDADGGHLRQLTTGSADSIEPATSADGSMVAFASFSDLDGTEGGGTPSADVFVIHPDGSGLRRLTTGAGEVSVSYLAPRLDHTGTWAVFASPADLTGENEDGSWEIFRIRTDGTQLEQLTSGTDPASRTESPDISGDGRWISFVSSADLLGTNGDGNREVFLYDTSDGILRQLTDAQRGESTSTFITDDGSFVFFVSSEPLLIESSRDSEDVCRAKIPSGEIQRLSALRIHSGWTGRPAASISGDRAVWHKWGDETDTNADINRELFTADNLTLPQLHITGRSQGGIHWDPEEGAFSYDSIRGDVTNLRFVDGVVDLGPVHCLEDDSPDLDVEIRHDQEDPDPWPGQIVFYLDREYFGIEKGNGSWGVASDGSPRQPGEGTCNP